MKRLVWIDLLRGFCMMAILWFHIEIYYAGYDVTPYAFYVGNVLAVFFFLSGYLFYQSNPIDFKKKIKSIVRYLLLPYFIFTIIIAIPKYLFYEDKTISSLLIEIIKGHASWFITALIISQLLFILFLKVTKQRIIYLFVLASCCLVLSHFIGNAYHPSIIYYEQNLWHFNESLLGCFLLFTGYLYHKYEPAFVRINTIPYTLLLFLVVCCIKYMIYKHHVQLVVGPIIVSNYPLFILDLLCSVLLLVHIFKKLPSFTIVEWTGSHSITYYFFCGAIPLIISYIFNKIGMEYQGFFSLLCAFITVYIVATLVTWLIYRYTPIFRK